MGFANNARQQAAIRVVLVNILIHSNACNVHLFVQIARREENVSHAKMDMLSISLIDVLHYSVKHRVLVAL
jgi:hypothetical protein